MQDQPLLLLLLLPVSAYVVKLWRDDLRAFRAGTPNPRALPGATPAPFHAYLIAASGALLILLTETWAELRLGLSEQQSTITWLFAAYTLMSAFVEEVIFRGFLVVDNKGGTVRWLAAFAASVVFALLHPFLWTWEKGQLTLNLDLKGWISTAAIFTGSLWFYAVRFSKFNPTRSLGPCFAAHFAKNLGVILIKLHQGHVAGLY